MILMSSGLVTYVAGFVIGSLFHTKNRNNDNTMTKQEIEQKLDEYDEIDKYDALDPDDIAERKLTLKEMRRSLIRIEQDQNEREKTILERSILWFSKTRIGSFLRRRHSQIALIFTALYVISLAVIGLASFHSFQVKAIVVGNFCAMGGFWAVYESGFLSEIKHNRVRVILIYILFFAISSSYFFGKDRAQKILEGGPNTLCEAESGRKYLGHTNGYFFLLSPDNSKVSIIRAKSLNNLVLVRKE